MKTYRSLFWFIKDFMSNKPEIVNESDEHLTRPQDLLSSKQIDKLNLEIESLRKKNRWERFSLLAPLIASTVTVIALVIGVLQFQVQQSALQRRATEERDRERTKLLQDQMRGDVDEISRFTQDKTRTIGRVSFLLDDMTIIMASTIPEGQSPQVLRIYERPLTKSLVEQIVKDADFLKNPRDVTFANTIVRNWKDYQNYLKEKDQLETLDSILYHYVRALRYLRKENTSYFTQLIYDENTQSYAVRNDSEKVQDEEILFQHIKQLLEGFRQHLNLMSADQRTLEIKKRITDFEDALCNASVAKHVLETDFICRPCMEVVLPNCSEDVLCCSGPTK